MIKFKSHPNIDKIIKKKRNKFGAIKCSHDGYKFDSIKEGDEYLRLRLRLQSGDISSLKIHPSYEIIINNMKICNVILDFEYFNNLTGYIEYIDVKGFDKITEKFRVTSESKLKRKLLEAKKQIKLKYV